MALLANRYPDVVMTQSGPGEGLRQISSKRFWGVVNRKERWGLSGIGWVLLVLLFVCLGTTTFFTIYPFLAVTHREKTDVLVVEGWVNQHIMRVAADEFRNGSYRRVFTTGGPVEGLGGYVSDYSTSASIGAGLLRKIGVPDEALQMVPSRVMDRDRTYAAAIALRDWFRANNFHPRTINVVTEGPHARRTRLLFQKAFGDEAGVGIISINSPDYDSAHWWRYSEGVKDIVSEATAYVYAKLFFYPSDPSSDKKTSAMKNSAGRCATRSIRLNPTESDR
jgi:uncharacterized SAM-binding protein YcdF (DUF218 family)